MCIRWEPLSLLCKDIYPWSLIEWAIYLCRSNYMRVVDSILAQVVPGVMMVLMAVTMWGMVLRLPEMLSLNTVVRSWLRLSWIRTLNIYFVSKWHWPDTALRTRADYWGQSGPPPRPRTPELRCILNIDVITTRDTVVRLAHSPGRMALQQSGRCLRCLSRRL